MSGDTPFDCGHDVDEEERRPRALAGAPLRFYQE
jgi:hypothetical protein